MNQEPARAYAAMVDAIEVQRARIGGDSGPERWTRAAGRFVADPRREPDANLKVILEYIRPDDVVLDVGGGAGRFGLPIALRCREVINIEPAKGMGEAFEAGARQAGVTNARWIGASWEDAAGVSGDVSLVVNVTYFVRDIVPFLQKLIDASRERVIIAMSVTPPPNQSAGLYELQHDQPLSLVPGYRELLPVLWEMGIVPDVRVLNEARASSLGGVYATREDAVRAVTAGASGGEAEKAVAGARIDARFEELFEQVDGGFRLKPSGDARMILVTWRTNS